MVSGVLRSVSRVSNRRGGSKGTGTALFGCFRGASRLNTELTAKGNPRTRPGYFVLVVFRHRTPDDHRPPQPPTTMISRTALRTAIPSSLIASRGQQSRGILQVALGMGSTWTIIHMLLCYPGHPTRLRRSQERRRNRNSPAFQAYWSGKVHSFV